MTRNVRTYDHFCLTARALERVGDRWSLLVIRDLLAGAKRFTDLMDRLGGITPKTLSQRLRELEDAGIVTADREPGRREVWYRLTPAGEDLGPVIDALGRWGLQHAWRRPLPGEPLHAEHLLRAAIQDPTPNTGHRAGYEAKRRRLSITMPSALPPSTSSRPHRCSRSRCGVQLVFLFFLFFLALDQYGAPRVKRQGNCVHPCVDQLEMRECQ